MSGRAAIYNLIVNNSILMNAPYNLNSDRVWSNFSLDKFPRDGLCVILRWGEWERSFGNTGKQALEVRGYQSKYQTSDFALLSNLMTQIEQILIDAIHVTGTDGWTVTCVDFLGRSDDGVDIIYNALLQKSSFQVIAHPS